jgi:hypothetical protein
LFVFIGDVEEAQSAAEEIVVKYLGDDEIGPATYGEVLRAPCRLFLFLFTYFIDQINIDDVMKEKIVDCVHSEACSREESNEGILSSFSALFLLISSILLLFLFLKVNF